MKSVLILIICLFACALSAEPIVGDMLVAEREQFKRAYGALTRGQTTQAAKLMRGLEDYPLYIYFRYHRLSRRLYKSSKQEVRDFLSAYDGSLLAERLRGDWLSFLGQKKQWADYLHDYRPQSRILRQKFNCIPSLLF